MISLQDLNLKLRPIIRYIMGLLIYTDQQVFSRHTGNTTSISQAAIGCSQVADLTVVWATTNS